MEFTEALHEIKNQISIEAKIGEVVKLRKSGSSFIGLCPMHEESTPSFHVFRNEQRFYCFGCKAKGDVIDFIVETTGLPWIEVVKNLAGEAGVELPKLSGYSTESKEKLSRLHDLNSAIVGWTKVQLFTSKNPGGNEALNYLKERELTNETISKNNLGYCRSSSELIYYLTKTKSYTESELMESGSFYRTANGSLRCHFETRITFPIRDLNGNYIGFGSRATEKAVQPKYINSSNSIIFDKSKSLYGLWQGYGAIKQQDVVIVVEGFIDVLMANQNGFMNVVAPMGTAFGESHVHLVKKFTNNIIMAFDNDKAGKLAAFKAIEVVKENFGTKLSAKLDTRGILRIGESSGANIGIASFPDSLDADETLRKFGPDTFNHIMKHAKSVVEYHIDSLDGSLMFNVKTATLAAGKIVPLIAEVKSPVERDTYIRSLANRLSISEPALRAEVSKISRMQNGKTQLQVLPVGKLAEVVSAPEVFEDIIMANLIKYFPESLEALASDGSVISTSDFINESNIILLTKLAELKQSKSNLTDINNILDSQSLILHFENLLSYAQGQPTLTSDDTDKSLSFLINKLRRNQFQKVYSQIMQALDESTSFDEAYMELVEAVVDIEKLMKVYSK